MIKRFSSRTHRLDATVLNQHLQGARAYDRIAGYFSSSILEVAGEAIESMQGKVRIICNSDLLLQDVETARAAEMAIRREWTRRIDEQVSMAGMSRFAKLHALLTSGKLDVRVLPNEYYGLIHGKAGVITKADGTKVAFMGSVNETWSAWRLNYEILWEDDSPDAIEWAQAEFDVLWNDPRIARLSDFVVKDIARIAKRKIISLDEWKKTAEPAGAVIEAPVYRKEYGLWAHQKYFVDLAYKSHVSGAGARYVLADMVGLGKTIQLALAAQLMALAGDKPVLIIAPKTLIWQWQEEVRHLLDMPSAVWDGKQWTDENGIVHPSTGPESIRNCPRLIGIVSQGLITRGSEATKHLLAQSYECVVVDECHRARRKNLRKDGENDPIQRNNLLAFIYQLASQTKSMLLATATPVQLYPIEAYDLLEVLSQGNDFVLGNANSIWRKDKKRTLRLVSGQEQLPDTETIMWEFARNPLPASDEKPLLLSRIRETLDLLPNQAVADGGKLPQLRPADRQRMVSYASEFFRQHNPFIRQIVRRTRDFLENEIDPSTQETYLKKVEVKLFGEGDQEAILLPGYLNDAYQTAEDFSSVLAQRMKSAGFMKMLLLKRMGSSIEAGKRTATKLLGGGWSDLDEEEEDATDEAETSTEQATKTPVSSLLTRTLTPEERALLTRLIQQLQRYEDKDPKYFKLHELLTQGIPQDRTPWLEYGCIIFSQYYDTIWDMAELLSRELPAMEIGLYAGGSKAGIIRDGRFTTRSKEEMVLRQFM